MDCSMTTTMIRIGTICMIEFAPVSFFTHRGCGGRRRTIVGISGGTPS